MYQPTLTFLMSVICLSSRLEEKNAGITFLLDQFRISFV